MRYRPPESNVLMAETADEARRLLRENRVDAVVVDQGVPASDGLDLLEAIRRSRPEIPRILMTGRADVAMLVQAINRAQVHQVILKPFEASEAAEILATFLVQRKGALGRIPPTK